MTGDPFEMGTEGWHHLDDIEGYKPGEIGPIIYIPSGLGMSAAMVAQLHAQLSDYGSVYVAMENSPNDTRDRLAEIFDASTEMRIHQIKAEKLVYEELPASMFLDRPRTSPMSPRETMRGDRPKRRKHKRR